MYYTDDDLTHWEFKIVRADWGEFASQEHLDAMLRQEAKAGWTLVEKYDNQHIRLKRPINARYQDVLLPRSIDPYRTTYTISQAFPFLIMAGCMLVSVVLIILLAIVATWPG